MRQGDISEIITKSNGSKDFCVFDASSLGKLKQPLPHHLFIFIRGLNPEMSVIMDYLKKVYPERYPVAIKEKISVLDKRNEIKWFPLYKLYRIKRKSYPFFLYLPPFYGHNISELMDIMERLRGDKGCPWDRQQNHMSLRPYLIEETYEVIEAINKKDPESLREELGDLLLQIIFHTSLAQESGHFSFSGVINKVICKLIRRHPHVFGNSEANTVGDVKKRWEEIKKEEKNSREKKSGLLDVDPFLPALMRAYKIQGKASVVGFDWTSLAGPLSKIKEELAELTDAHNQRLPEKTEEELGDLLFSVVNASRFLGVNPEVALSGAIDKFCERFSYIENKALENGKDISSYSLQELDKWWNEAKNN